MKIIITGDCPSKKNSRVNINRGGRIFSFPGANYRQWHVHASKQLLAYKQPGLPLDIVSAELKFYPSTKRKSDLTNKAEAIMDLLVDNGFLVDDNWFSVFKITLTFCAVDRVAPRVEIELVGAPMM